ncbi:MAG: hypothetical protein QOD98_2746, partial [Nocardioidaceae bacterium]|nr:hypothetical protein [Nocardioidaceae bacterium]
MSIELGLPGLRSGVDGVPTFDASD